MHRNLVFAIITRISSGPDNLISYMEYCKPNVKHRNRILMKREDEGRVKIFLSLDILDCM